MSVLAYLSFSVCLSSPMCLTLFILCLPSHLHHVFRPLARELQTCPVHPCLHTPSFFLSWCVLAWMLPSFIPAFVLQHLRTGTATGQGYKNEPFSQDACLLGLESTTSAAEQHYSLLHLSSPFLHAAPAPAAAAVLRQRGAWLQHLHTQALGRVKALAP
jgi:hypothetical protein